MQLFPPSHELQFLLGKELSSVRFEPGGVHFIWSGGGEIHAMRDFDHTDPAGVEHRFGKGMWTDPPSMLHRLIQHSVAALETNDNSLTLTFDDGQTLVLHSATGTGEHGLIQFGDDLKDDYIVY